MKVEEFLSRLTPDMYRALRQALELGKWPDGRPLTSEQRNITLQALIMYEHDHIPEAERIGYMPQQCKSKSAERETPEQDSIIRFKV